MWKYIAVGFIVVIAGVGYYAISPLFRNVEVNEALPGAIYAPEAPMNESVPAQSEPAVALATAPIVDTAAHPASGTASVIAANDKLYLRYEDFTTINGPDLYIYLAKNLDADEFVDLGRMRATSGNVNYEIPAGVDPSEYPYALVWCKAFGVLFNSAKLY